VIPAIVLALPNKRLIEEDFNNNLWKAVEHSEIKTPFVEVFRMANQVLHLLTLILSLF
jgi:hypothetical protein